MNFLESTTDFVQPTRNFSLAYIIIDSIFVLSFLFLLFFTKRRLNLIWSLAGGILYFLVDFGIFYLLTKSRAIYLVGETTTLCNDLQTGGVLFWMSMSYGILDFSFIWLWLSKDKKALEFSALIVIFWICCPLIADFINNLTPSMLYFMTTRGTAKYHGIMGLIMLVGYAIVIVMNILNKDEKSKKIPIVRLFIIGFMAQFLWEFLLFIFGIRSQNYNGDITRAITTMLQDSLVETNLGMPYIYFIHKALTNKYQEDLQLVDKKKLLER